MASHNSNDGRVGGPSFIDALDRHFVRANKVIVGLLLGGMTLLVLANVTTRFAVGSSFEWAEELSVFMMAWMTLLGAGLVLRVGGHLAVDGVQQLCGRKIGQLMRLLSALVMLMFFLTVVWAGASYVELGLYQTSPSLGIPRGYAYLALPVGGVLMILHLLAIARRYIATNTFAADDDLDSYGGG
jgi:TRAP-type C4-dicarboxylate transport system permease small subunit